MGVKLVSVSGGSVEINPPATASNFVATMPAGTGNVVVNGVNGALVSGTAQASTSGTSIDFTGIPSWVKRITVLFNGVSTNGTSNPQLQIGSGSVTTTGYSAVCSGYQSTVSGATATFTSGFGINSASASATLFGSVRIENITGNTWTATIVTGSVGSGISFFGGGAIALSGTLDRVRITTVNGTDTFDAGSINILYE